MMINLIAVVAAANLCFGPKPVVCEAWHQVFNCDKWGCMKYPEIPMRHPDNTLAGVSGGTQWIPDDNGVLMPECMFNSCEIDPKEYVPIPQHEMKPADGAPDD